jgi:hypothetical protein
MLLSRRSRLVGQLSVDDLSLLAVSEYNNPLGVAEYYVHSALEHRTLVCYCAGNYSPAE